MLNDHFFYFIKDDLIDPNTAFIQNVDNFLFYIYFGYVDRYESSIKKEKKILLTDLFRNIKSLLMGGGMRLGEKKININEKVVKILKEDEKKREKKLKNLFKNVKRYYENQNILDKLIEYSYKDNLFVRNNFAEMKVNLILYCILVNGLDKTKGKKFDKIKEEMQPLIKILKEMFCEFDQNEIHKERTFILALRSSDGYKKFYIINNKENMLKYDHDESDYYYDVMRMFLSKYEKDEKDERKYKYYSIVLDNSLHNFEE